MAKYPNMMHTIIIQISDEYQEYADSTLEEIVQ